jgi:hypothetical protein
MTWLKTVQEEVLNQHALVGGRALSYPSGLEVLHARVRLLLREMLEASIL